MTSPRLHRRLLRAAVSLLALYVLYLVAGNVFLNTSIGRDVVNRKPEKFRMEWEGGLTLWPGQVTLRGIRLEGLARNIAWDVQAEAARGRIALWPLLRKELRFPWIDADQVTGGARRIAPREEVPATVTRAGGWQLRFDRIGSDSLVRGHFGNWVVAGKGRAGFGFLKRTRGGPMEILPSTGSFEQARVTVSDELLLHDARIDVAFAIASHLSRDAPGMKKFALLDGTLAVDGRSAALQAVVRGDGGYDFSTQPGDGELQAKLALVRGRVQPGSTLEWNAPLIAIDARGARHDNALALSLEADPRGGLHLLAKLPETDAKLLSLDADLRVDDNTLPLDGEWKDRLRTLDGKLRGRWHFRSLDWLARLFIGARWLDLDGHGTVEADVLLEQGHLLAGSVVRVPQVDASARVLGNHIHGVARAEAVIDRDADGRERTRMDLAMARFEVSPESDRSRPYVTGQNLEINLVGDRELARMRETLQGRVRFRDAHIPDLRAYNRYLPNAEVQFGGGSGRLAGDLRLDGDGEVGAGTLRVDGKRTQLVVAGVRLTGDVVVDGRLRGGDLQAGNLDLSGTSVQLRNVSFVERDGRTQGGWWGTLDVGGGHVEWRRPATVRGRIDARMKDVGFLLALFSDRGGYPAWIGKLVDSGQARMQGQLLWQGDTLVLDRMHAANDRLVVDARMRLQGQNQTGDLYAKWGVLGVGVELQGGERKLHLRNAREWYDSRPHLLR